MEKPNIDPEEWMISLEDVKQLYFSMWKKLIVWSVVGGAFTFLYFANTHVKYKAEGSFKEGVERSSSASFFKEMLGSVTSQNQPQAATIMKSNQVLKPVAERLGLQISPVKKEWYIAQLFSRFKEAYRAEKRKRLEDLDPFQFENAHYLGETAIPFNLQFTSPSHFVVYDEEKRNILGKGAVGEKVSLEEFCFTLKRIPKGIESDRFYPFSICNWMSAVGSLRSAIDMENDKDNHSIINISFADRDRFLATEVVNVLMEEYQKHLKREYNHVAEEQLVYLENKQDQIFQKMDHLFDEHAAYLRKNLRDNGFAGLEQESQSLLVPHQQMHNKLLQIDVELARIDRIEKEGKITVPGADGPFTAKLGAICQAISDLKQEKDLIGLTLSEEPLPSFDEKKRDLEEARSQRLEVQRLIDELQVGGEISAYSLNEGLGIWARAIESPQEKGEFASYLENYSRLLSMKEKILEERFFFGNAIPEELEGLDLKTLRNLFVDYNAKLDQTEKNIRHYEKLKGTIPKSDFELSSLSSILTDPLSQKLIQDASGLMLKIKDEKHRTSKELNRWDEEIRLYRNILLEHIDQLLLVEQLNVDVIREKISGLQKVSFDCINRQISVLKEQAGDCIQERRESLSLEKALLESKMEAIRANLSHLLPEKWRFEQWLNIKTGMVSKIMETVTEVVESKTMTTQMHHVESKPLDPAITPLSPQHPKLFLMAYLGAFSLPCLLFSFRFISQLFKGFPLSLEKLKALKLPVLGPISTFCDGPAVENPTGPDLDLLRKISFFSEGGKVISLVGGKGPDYTYALGENLARRHVKTVILRCDFLSTFRKEDAPGILQVWKNETAELPIRKGKGFDYITAGGFSPFGTEIIQSDRFMKLIEILKKKYDWVYLYFHAPLSSAESLAALQISDKAVVTVCGEQTEELTPFIDWGYDEGHCRLTFITRA